MALAEETAVVSFIEGDYAFLTANSLSACSSCAARSSCGARTMTKMHSGYSLRVKNTMNLKKGDSVVLGLESNVLIFGTVVMYILPLMLLFIFSYIGKIMHGEFASIIGGILGLLSGLLIVHYKFSKNRTIEQFSPKIICMSP